MRCGATASPRCGRCTYLACVAPSWRRPLDRRRVWRRAFAELWTVSVPRLRRAAGATTRRLGGAVAPRRAGAAGPESPVPPGLGELVLAATGRQLASSVLGRMRSAERVVFFPGLE